jgi:hypothetical protein
MPSAKPKLLTSFLKISSLALALMLPAAGSVFAAQLPFPPPRIFTPPPPPCISTGSLFEFPPGCFTCQVRDASPDNFGETGVTINLLNEQNQVVTTTGGSSLGPGMTATSVTFCSRGGFNFISCMVTTGVGTVAALRDLAVVEQFAPGVAEGDKTSTSPSAAETEGKIFNSCQPVGPPVPAP